MGSGLAVSSLSGGRWWRREDGRENGAGRFFGGWRGMCLDGKGWKGKGSKSRRSGRGEWGT